MSGKEWENERSSTDFGDKVWVFPFSQETKLVDFKHLTQIILKDNHKEDIETSGTFPSPRLGSTLPSVGDEVFVLFGFSDRYENEVSVLNKETFQWSQRQTENTPLPRTFHTANTFGNNIYIFGGNYLTKAFNDLIAFEAGSNKFNRLAAEGTTPPPRFSHTSAIVGDNLYIIGGTDGNNIFNDIFVYHISSNTWSQLPSSLPPLANAISSVSAQNIIVYDPQTGGFYSINTDSKATSSIPSLQNGRKLRTIVADDSSLYLIDDQSGVYSVNVGELNHQDITNDQSAISHPTSPKGANELAHKELLLVRADIDALKAFRQKYLDFQNELSSAKQTAEELQSQLSGLREELNTSKQQLSDEQTSHSNTREESTRLQNEIAELKNAASLVTEETQKLRDELSIASSNENKGDSSKKDSEELQAKDREISKLKEALAEKNKIVETQQTTITSLNQLAALLSSPKNAAPVVDPKIEELTQLSSEKDKRLSELEEQLNTLRNSESQSNSLQTTIDSLNETLRSYESKILSLETNITDLHNEKQQLQEEVNAKSDALTVSQTLANELQLLIQVKDRVIEELESSSQKTPETTTNDSTPITTESEGDDEKLLFIMSEFDSYKAAVEEEKDSLLNKIEELSNSVLTLTNDLQLAQENINSLQEQLNNGDNGAARGDDAYFALEEEHNNLKQSITSIKEEHLSTTKLLREKIADLNIKLATSGGSKETKNLQAQVSKLTEEITTFQKLVDEQQLAIQEKDNDIQLLLNTVEDNKQTIEKLEADIEVWMTTTDQIQKIGEDAVTEISKEAVSLRAENEKLQQQISEEIQRRRYAEEELFNSEAKLKDIEGLMGRLSGSL